MSSLVRLGMLDDDEGAMLEFDVAGLTVAIYFYADGDVVQHVSRGEASESIEVVKDTQSLPGLIKEVLRVINSIPEGTCSDS
jgi:hypothetical protein